MADKLDQEAVMFLLFVGVAVLYYYFKKVVTKTVIASIISFVVSFLLIVAGVTIFVFLIVLLFKLRIKRRGKLVSFQERLNNVTKDEYFETIEVVRSLDKLKRIVDSDEKLSKKSECLINALYERLNYILDVIVDENKNIEKQEELELKIEAKKQNKIRIKIQELYNYFFEKDSIESIPKYARSYPIEIIKKAQEKFKDFKYSLELEEEEQIEAEENEQEIINHVLEIKGLPANYSELSTEDKWLYDEKLEQFEKGELKPIIKLSEDDEQLLEKSFYLANELNDEQKELLTKHFEYQYYSFTYLDGKLGNNLIIKNTSKTESNYHFCMKHLIARIDSENSIVEYTIKDLRADVVFTYNKKRIAVEVEKGTNNKKSIIKKVELLNKYFDYWIITCPKVEQKHYREYVDKQKSFCLRSKQTQEKILQLKGLLQRNNK